MHFWVYGGQTNLFLIFKTFGQWLRVASDDGKVSIRDFCDDAAVASVNVVAVSVHNDLTFRLGNKQEWFKALNTHGVLCICFF